MGGLEQLKQLQLQNAAAMRKRLVSLTKGEKKKEKVDTVMRDLYFNFKSTMHVKGPETNTVVLANTFRLQINQVLDEIQMALTWLPPHEILKLLTLLSKISLHKLQRPFRYIEKNKDKINKKSELQIQVMEKDLDTKYNEYVHSITKKLKNLYNPHIR